MPSAAALRIQIESSLERRFPSALTPVPRTIRETAATGIPEVDRLLEGGLPVGAISEVTGPECSGRTSLILAFLAERTRQGQVCAWVDAHDAFDAESAAASGVSLKQLLWVRCRGTVATARQGAEKGQAGKEHTSGAKAQPLFCGVCGTAEAVSFQNVFPQESFSAACKACVDSGAYVPGINPRPTARETGAKAQPLFCGVYGTTEAVSFQNMRRRESFAADRKAKPWSRLDQALRATDLLLQAGGFAALVLDLGSTAAEHGCRIPLATWFRFRQAADRTRCSLLVLGTAPFAQSSAAVVLECAPKRLITGSETVLAGSSYELRSGRQRFTPSIAGLRKQPASTWSASSPWQREAGG